MNTPTIITVYDSKLHEVAKTVVDYSDVDAVVLKIKPTCEKNQWTYKVTVAASLTVFEKYLGV